MELNLPDLRDGYGTLVRHILTYGDEVAPRGIKTREVLGAMIRLTDPSGAVTPVGVGRGLNVKIGSAEIVQLIAGVSNAHLMGRISSNFKQFIEFDRFYGAYGPRIFRQVPLMIRELTLDRDTRRAGLAILRPDDVATSSCDIPCTMDLRFFIRDQKLHMHTVMRSNDVVWGVTYDFWQFTALQQVLAWALGYPIGEYVHYAASLHAYVDRDAEILNRLHAYDGSFIPPAAAASFTKAEPRETIVALRRWRHAVNVAEAALGIRPPAVTHKKQPCLAWHQAQIEDVVFANQDERLCFSCRYVLPSHYFTAKRCRWCDADGRFKVPIGTYARMMLVQHGKCAICQKTDELLWMDHEHSTGIIRGLLCGRCNLGLGHFKDDPTTLGRAIAYLGYDGDLNDWTQQFEFLYRTQRRDMTSMTSMGR